MGRIAVAGMRRRRSCRIYSGAVFAMGLLARRRILTIIASRTPTTATNIVIRVFRPSSGKRTGMDFGGATSEAWPTSQAEISQGCMTRIAVAAADGKWGEIKDT